MIAKNLLVEIGFSEEEQREYERYSALVGDSIETIAGAFMRGEKSYDDAMNEACALRSDALHECTAALLFVLSCTGYLEAEYEKRSIPRELFVNMMRDVKYKLDAFAPVVNVFGFRPSNWYEGHLRLTRMAFGRLQYDIMKYEGEPITVRGFGITEGDLLLNCHIPEAGPLLPELCIDSFKQAYDFFGDRLKGGILPITCESWLLYPPHRAVFGEGSNTVKFIDLFEMTGSKDADGFHDMWRVFGRDLPKDGVIDTSELPAETRMQRSFIKYIDNGGSFGEGIGYILFDGEKVLTKK